MASKYHKPYPYRPYMLGNLDGILNTFTDDLKTFTCILYFFIDFYPFGRWFIASAIYPLKTIQQRMF